MDKQRIIELYRDGKNHLEITASLICDRTLKNIPITDKEAQEEVISTILEQNRRKDDSVEWINANEILPEFGQRVIVLTDKQWVGEVLYCEGEKWIRYDQPSVVTIEKLFGQVLKWMALPCIEETR